MADLVVTLIGAITIFCGAQSASDPCKNGFPKPIEVFVPDGRTGSHVCLRNFPEKEIPRHLAFIRVRAKMPAVSGWKGQKKCKDEIDGICYVYPLNADIVDITNVTTGSGVTSFNDPSVYTDVRWGALSNLTLAPNPPHRNVRLTIRNGTINFKNAGNGMKEAVITVTGVSGDTVVTATRVSNGAKRSLMVPEGGLIDIINAPKDVALDHPGNPNFPHGDDKHHFFLHYVMATPPPEENCCGPRATEECCLYINCLRSANTKATRRSLQKVMDRREKLGLPRRPEAPSANSMAKMPAGAHGAHLGGSVSCSNSVYP